VNRFLRGAAGMAIVSLLALPAAAADISLGLITSMTGPGASIGIPYSKGTAAGEVYKDDVNGIKINYAANVRVGGEPALERTVTDVKIGGPLDPSLFKRSGP